MQKFEECDRAFLTGMMDDYLHKLLQHDPAGLPLDLELPSRENAEVVEVGKGKAWTSADRLLSGFSAADVVSGEVVYFGGVEIDGEPNAFFVRIKVKNRQIVESEIMYMDDGKRDGLKTIFPRDNAGLYNVDDLVWLAKVPENRRSSREHMLAIANAWLDALNVSHDDGRIPIDPKCERYESGLRMTNNFVQTYGGVLALSGPCSDGVNLPPDLVERIYNRRFFVADEESGIVAAAFMMQFSPKAPLGLGEEHVMEVYELYKIVDGRIREINANTLLRIKPPYQSGFPDTDTSSWKKLPILNG